MRKANFFYVFIFAISLVACNLFPDYSGKLATSEGSLNEVAIFMANDLWHGEIGDSLREKLANPIDGLVNEESALLLKQYAPNAIDATAKKMRNIVVIEMADENEFIHVENEFATPQNVFYFRGESQADLLELISLHGEVVENSIRFYELLQIQSKIGTHIFNDSHIKNRFQISLLIPDSYNYALTAPHFVWLKRNTQTGSNSLMIYQIPASRFNNAKNITQNFIEVRDSITKKYVHGVASNSHMYVNTSFSPFVKKTFFNEEIGALEFRGTWDLSNDYMEGPYLCYLFTIDEGKNYLFLDGFIYNPALPNRADVFELEAIMKSIYFN